MQHRVSTYKFIFSGIITLLVILLLFYGVWPFISSFFGAAVLYVLLKPLHTYASKKFGWNVRLVAFLLILLSIIVIIVPLVYVTLTLQNQIADTFELGGVFSQGLGRFSTLFPSFDLQQVFADNIPSLGGYLADLFLNTFEAISTFFINLVIMYFLVFYLLVDSKLIDKFKETLPFSSATISSLTGEFTKITHSTVIVTGILAILQGILLGLAFYVLGIPGAIVWGVVAVILGFIPVIGTPFIWGPVVILSIFEGNYLVGAILFVWGMFLSNVDNLIRPKLQSDVGDVHPLITVVGVFMGIYLFGLVGLIVGPLLISYSIIILKAFRKEYLEED